MINPFELLPWRGVAHFLLFGPRSTERTEGTVNTEKRRNGVTNINSVALRLRC
jgi:hypothetical protein